MPEQISTTHSLQSLQSRLGLQFNDEELLRNSLTHRSFSFEQEGAGHNERLEFLGDAVLGLVITDLIFNWYPQFPEGELAKLRAAVVNMAVLADLAVSIGLGAELLVGRGEELSGGRAKPSILADAFEAVLGAVYLDQGIETTRRVIERLFADKIRDHAEGGVVRDFKTALQEVTVASQGLIPEYRITSSGPDHAKRFRAQAYLSGRMLGEGEGRSKKEAEQAAAKEALAQISRE